MEQHNLSVYEFAGSIDSNPQTVGRWLRGEVCPRLEFAVLIARRFGVSIDWLTGVSDDPRLRTAKAR